MGAASTQRCLGRGCKTVELRVRGARGLEDEDEAAAGEARGTVCTGRGAGPRLRPRPLSSAQAPCQVEGTGGVCGSDPGGRLAWWAGHVCRAARGAWSRLAGRQDGREGLPPQTCSSGLKLQGSQEEAGGLVWLAEAEALSTAVRLGRAGVGGSVVLEQGEQVLVAVGGQVGRAQVGQQLVRVGQFWEQLRTKANGPQKRPTRPVHQQRPVGGRDAGTPPVQALCRGSSVTRIRTRCPMANTAPPRWRRECSRLRAHGLPGTRVALCFEPLWLFVFYCG